MSKVTKKQLEKELFELTKERNELLGRLNKEWDRKKIAGLYLQALNLMQHYTEDSFCLTKDDYKRLSKVLEFDEFPEGF